MTNPINRFLNLILLDIDKILTLESTRKNSKPEFIPADFESYIEGYCRGVKTGTTQTCLHLEKVIIEVSKAVNMLFQGGLLKW